jgi:hypothetical protein
MEVNSAQPNIVAGLPQITVSLPNKGPVQDVLAISAPNCLQRNSEQKNYAGNNLGQNMRAISSVRKSG